MTERIEVKGSPTLGVATADWQAQTDELRAQLIDAGYDVEQCATDLREAFGDITFHDSDSRPWRHDGVAWWRWDGAAWIREPPPTHLTIASVVFDVEPAPEPPAPAAADGYRRTHTVPAVGLWAWSAPDPSQPAVARLDPYLDVQVVDQRADGWAKVRCSNGWETWVDGRALVAAPDASLGTVAP